MEIETQILAFHIFGVAWIILGLLSLYFQQYLFKMIKDVNPERWGALGKPSIFMQFEGMSAPPWEQWGLTSRLYSMYKLTLIYIFKGDKQLDSNRELFRLRRINKVIIQVSLGLFIFYFLAFGSVINLFFTPDFTHRPEVQSINGG